MELREKIARTLCEVDCGKVTENELARCHDLADAILAIPEIRDALEAKRRLDCYEGLAEHWGKLTINRVEYGDGRMVGQPAPVEKISREEAQRRWPNAD